MTIGRGSWRTVDDVAKRSWERSTRAQPLRRRVLTCGLLDNSVDRLSRIAWLLAHEQHSSFFSWAQSEKKVGRLGGSGAVNSFAARAAQPDDMNLTSEIEYPVSLRAMRI
jgi:hypothetical protein